MMRGARGPQGGANVHREGGNLPRTRSVLTQGRGGGRLERISPRARERAVIACALCAFVTPTHPTLGMLIAVRDVNNPSNYDVCTRARRHTYRLTPLALVDCVALRASPCGPPGRGALYRPGWLWGPWPPPSKPRLVLGSSSCVWIRILHRLYRIVLCLLLHNAFRIFC